MPNLTTRKSNSPLPVVGLAILLLAGCPVLRAAMAAPQVSAAMAPRMTARYHFLGPEDTLSILQEENLLKGYIDVFTGENESDAILSYQITIGSRKGNDVVFRTRRIHEKYYRFSGMVERGTGKKPGDPDYLQLAGEVETITSNSVTGERKVEKQRVVLKSIPPGEGPPD